MSKNSKNRNRRNNTAQGPGRRPPLKDGDKDWDTGCMNCGGMPTVHPTGLCGPCCFGEADTADGNW